MNPLPNNHALLRVMNPAVSVFRGTLWFLPTAFLVVSLVAIEWGCNWSGLPVDYLLIPGLILNIAFIMVTGWFHAWLSVDAHMHPGVGRWKILKFCLLQLLLVPVILIGASILLWSFNGHLKIRF